MGAIFRYGGQGKPPLFIFIFWLCCVFIAAHTLSLVTVSRGYSAVTVRGLLISVVSLVVGPGL